MVAVSIWCLRQNHFILLPRLRQEAVFHTRRPHTAKIHTLLNACGLKRHPIQDAQ